MEEEKKRRKRKDGPKVHLCQHPGCGKAFNRPYRLENHARIHTGERPFQCEHCDKSFTRRSHLRRHGEVNHSQLGTPSQGQYACDQCDKVFTLQHNLRKHVRRFHKVRAYTCTECPAAFHKHHLLRGHVAERHSATAPGVAGGHTVVCPECGKGLFFMSHLRVHMRVHQGYQCDSCDLKLEKWSDLVQHRAIHRDQRRQEEATRLQACTTCGKQFRNRANLRKHQQVHAETRDVYHCPEDYCPRYFYFMRNPNQHLASYHEGRRFHCTVPGCQQKLSTRQKLQEHLTTVHSEAERPPPPERAAKRKPRRPRKDRGQVKKPMAARLTGVEATSRQKQQALLGGEEKRPLDPLDQLKADYEKFMASNQVESSDSEASVVLGGCRRGLAHARKRKEEENNRANIATAEPFFPIGVMRRYKRDRFFKKLALPAIDPLNLDEKEEEEVDQLTDSSDPLEETTTAGSHQQTNIDFSQF